MSSAFIILLKGVEKMLQLLSRSRYRGSLRNIILLIVFLHWRIAPTQWIIEKIPAARDLLWSFASAAAAAQICFFWRCPCVIGCERESGRERGREREGESERERERERDTFQFVSEKGLGDWIPRKRRGWAKARK
jgi:hypothetical protein